MAQRLTQQRQLYFGEEATEGTEVLGVGANAIAVTNLVMQPDLAFYRRPILGRFGSLPGKIGAQPDPALMFTVQCRVAGTGGIPKLDPLLERILAPGADDTNEGTFGGTTISSVSGQPRKILNVTSGAGFSVGNAVAVETATNVFEVGWIESNVSNVITLTHDLTTDPIASARVKPSITYKPQDSAHGSLSFQVWLDTTNYISFAGSKGSMKFDVPGPGAPPTMTFGFRAMSYSHLTGTRPTPTWDSAATPSSYKFKVNSSSYDVKLMSWDLRQIVARKRSQNSSTGTIGQLMTDRDLVGVFQSYDVDETQFTDWKNGTEQAIAHQFGSTLNNIVAYQIPRAQRRDLMYGDDNGLTTDLVAFQGNIASGADDLRLAFL